jgi:hypothetical protein
MVGARYDYWITPVMTTAANGTHGYTPDVCIGTPPALLKNRLLLVVQERCITAVGQALSGATVRGTARVQMRTSSAKPFFPIPGVWGTQCVNISGGSISPGNVGCSTTTSIGSNPVGYNGSLGSNGRIYAGMRAWGVNPNTATPADPAAPAPDPCAPAAAAAPADAPAVTAVIVAAAPADATAPADPALATAATDPPPAA